MLNRAVTSGEARSMQCSAVMDVDGMPVSGSNGEGAMSGDWHGRRGVG